MFDESFKDFVADQLHDLSGLRFKKMFGGCGVYQGTLFFGLIADSDLYFKTNESTRGGYLEKGMQPFMYDMKDGVKSLKTYYRVPIEIIEDEEELMTWARRAIGVAATTKKK